MSTGTASSDQGESGEFRSRVLRFFKLLGRAWLKIRRFVGVLFLVRFSLVMWFIGLAVVFIDQGREILIAMADTPSTLPELLRKGLFVIATVLCAASAWYTSRVMFHFRFKAPASHACWYPRFKNHFPRWLGASFMGLVAMALVGADRRNWLLALILVVVTVLFLYFVYKRRDWFGLEALGQPGILDSITELPPTTKAVLLVVFGLNLASMILFTYFYLWLGPVLGTASVVLLAMALMIPVGSTFVYTGNRYRVPLIGLFLVFAVIFSLFNDNHRVRQTADMRPYEPVEQAVARTRQVSPVSKPRSLAKYQDIETYFMAWLGDLKVGHGNEAIPVVLVATEGGGIRAAFWTASVLAELQDRAAAQGIDFARHVFAISGVSGGSLGAAVFSALQITPYEDRKEGEKDENCAQASAASYRCRAQRILARDFLSPTVSVLLFPDLLQRFLPVAIFDDRALALERSWEQAWQRYETGDHLAKAFEGLWKEEPFGAPLLFLNSTVVETGQRIIVNPITFESASFRHTFHDAHNAADVIGAQVPLSTAVHMSARFTYVSPAGTIERQDPERTPDELAWFRVVDGGYFENSGAVTLDEILLAVKRQAKHAGVLVRPIVIHISNEPIKKPQEVVEKSSGKRVFMGEALSPVRALLHVRPARGDQARDVLAERVTTPADEETGKHVHFRLCDYGVTLPLGWMLSGLAQKDMTHQLIGYPENPPGVAPIVNAAKLNRVVDLLAGSPDSGRGEISPDKPEMQCWRNLDAQVP
jgi:predicted acylesterase/phospholipase RssA